MEISYQPCLVTQRLKASLWSLWSPTTRLTSPSVFLLAASIWSHLHSKLGKSKALLLPKNPVLGIQRGEKAALADPWPLIGLLWLPAGGSSTTPCSSLTRGPLKSLLHSKTIASKNMHAFSFCLLTVSSCLLLRLIYTHWHIRKVTGYIKYCAFILVVCAVSKKTWIKNIKNTLEIDFTFMLMHSAGAKKRAVWLKDLAKST